MQVSSFVILVSYLGSSVMLLIASPVFQTRRKPSGVCGAALYIAALSHGYDYTKADIVSPDARTDLLI